MDKASDGALGIQQEANFTLLEALSCECCTHVEFTLKQVVKQTKLFVFISNIIHQMECVSYLKYFSPFERRLRPWVLIELYMSNRFFDVICRVH